MLQKQSLPLEQKIILTKQRIKEYHDHFDGNIYVAFSGGKDSTVVLDIVRSIYPDTIAVFCDTGLEYPEIKEFVKTIDNVTIIKPKMSFKDVINRYGYPLISKTQATAIYKLTHQNLTEKYRNKLLYGDEKGTAGKLSNKWHYLLNAPFSISDKCCDALKKRPFLKFEKETGLYPITGEMASDSQNRMQNYFRYGCNLLDTKHPRSKPLSTWLEKDIWEYIKRNNIPYSKIYDMGVENTGCIFCMFGVHLDKEPNRFQCLKKTHPKLYNYCINDLELGKVLDHINVKY